MHSQSYCIKAGTHGPGGGDGYLYAPPKGPAEDAATTILRNSVNHPEISQSSIQTLPWAIIARAKFEDLSNEHKATAARLLTPRQLASLNRNALDLPTTGPLADNLPDEVRMLLQAEADLRRMLASPATSFAELERLAGMAGVGEGSRATPLGRWNHDRLWGGDGRDTLVGGRGDDAMWGGAGDDILVGGRGSDLMNGGAGSDLFAFLPDRSEVSEQDTIVGFDLGADLLSLQGGVTIISESEVIGSTVLQLSSGGSIALQGILLADWQTLGADNLQLLATVESFA